MQTAATMIGSRPGPWSFVRFEHTNGTWHWRLFSDGSAAVWANGKDASILLPDAALNHLPSEALAVIHEGLTLYVKLLETPRDKLS